MLNERRAMWSWRFSEFSRKPRTNVHKHSEGTLADIRLHRAGDSIAREVRDYGKGLSEAVLKESNGNWYASLGVGLRGMNERMRQLGGELYVCLADPGTLVRAMVPMQLKPGSQLQAE